MEHELDRIARELRELGQQVRTDEAKWHEAIQKRNAKVEESIRAKMPERLIARLAGFDSRTPVHKIRKQMDDL